MSVKGTDSVYKRVSSPPLEWNASRESPPQFDSAGSVSKLAELVPLQYVEVR